MIKRPLGVNIVDKGEKEFFEFLNSWFDDTYILYHNYEIKGKEFDFLFMHRELGLFLFEVKKWSGYDILEVIDNNNLKFIDNKKEIKIYEGNPLKQARAYKFNLLNKIKELYGFNPRIIHAVAYPNMNKNTFDNKNIEIYTEKCRTILRDDLANKDSFIKKLSEMKLLNKSKEEKLSENQFDQIRSIFEDLSYVDNRKSGSLSLNENFSVSFLGGNNRYSYFIFLKENDCTEDKLLKVIKYWKEGTKVYLCSDNYDILERFKALVNKKLLFLKDYKQFKIEDSITGKYLDSIFNLNTYFYEFDDIKSSFEVIDGMCNSELKNLEAIDKKTNFNMNQFLLEHFQCKKDIIVEAGAGTGKTYSMISRITYLIYKHEYSPDDILNKIAMITFTNEAANNMKRRLKEYYQNYYLLTQKIEALEFVEGIDNINISTIHSLSKTIIDKFSHLIGLGANASVYSGKFEVDKLINKYLNKYKEDNYKKENMIDDIEYRLFKFAEVMRLILDKLEQKNINLKNGYELDYGYDKKCEIINEILPKVQEELITESIKENKVKLSHIMILILDILNIDSDYIKKTIKLDYLFIDEFQDTDDVQIDIVKKFKEIIGFNVLVVGDVKQCIYRFRGADESAFKKLRGDTPKQYNTFELTKNYRTDKKLLDDFNYIFESWTPKNYLEYKSRLIGIKDINRGKNAIEKVDFIDSEFEVLFVEKLNEEIGKMRLKNKTGKIAIIVRTNLEIEKIREIGKKHNIRIKADVGNDLFETVATKDLYRLVVALKYNLDPKCLFGLFNTNYMVSSYDKKQLLNMRGDRRKQLEYFNNINGIEKWDYYNEGIKKDPVMKVIREIISDLKPWNNYASNFKGDEDKKINATIYKKNLEQLIEWLIETTNNEYLTINKLVSKLEIAILSDMYKESRTEMINNSKVEEVEILCATVHKTKGLEYDTVILPYCNANKNKTQDVGRVEILVDESTKKIGYSFKDDNQIGDKFKRINNQTYNNFKVDEMNLKLKEEVRILYVALTRAISRVIYFSDMKNKKNQEIRWQDFINKEV